MVRAKPSKDKQFLKALYLLGGLSYQQISGCLFMADTASARQSMKTGLAARFSFLTAKAPADQRMRDASNG
jgi:hypothetical protein